MKQVILDTSFILMAIRTKIDFLETLKFKGFQVIVPIQVLNELEKIIESKKKLKFRDEAELALKLLKKTKTIDIGNDYVDKGLIDYSEQNKEIIVATMDKELKSELHCQKLVIRGKRLEIL